jgi:hypothetical protein
MRARRPSFTLAALVAGAAGAAAAGATAGVGGCGPHPAVATPGPAPAASGFFDGWRGWEKMNARPFHSEGHTAGKFVVDVYVNGVGAEGFKAKKNPLPVGTVIIKEHFHEKADGGAGDAALLTSMEKKAPGYDAANGDWEYAKTSPDGAKVDLRGKEKVCVDCHVTAPGDYVFGMP